MAAGVRVTVYAAQAVAEAKRLSVEGRAKIAHQAAGDARGTAPVETGAFRAGIGVEAGGSRVAIVANSPDSGYIEFGTSDTPAHMTLVSAARKYGRYSGMTGR